MNPRVRYSQKYNKLVCHLDGSEFPYTPRNQESLAKALAALSAHGTRVLEALDTHAGLGRPLTDAELQTGVDHDDPRSLSQRIADQMPDPPAQTDNSNANPYQIAIDRGWDKDRRPETKAQAYRRKAAEFEAKRQAEADKAAFDADPQRQRAIAHAKRELDALRFDPSATVETIEQAEARLHIARHKSLDDYREMDRHWQQQKRAKIDVATNEITKQIDALKAKRVEFESHEFDPPAPPKPEQPQSPKYEKILLSDPRHPQYVAPETPIVVG